MQHLKMMLSSGLLIGSLWFLNARHGPLPPPGKFLDPFHGFWQNAELDHNSSEESLELDGLHAPVTILFDDRQIPHIFAENDHDLYFAQGFVTARDRLWQMEFQTRAAAGRLAEVVGPKALEYDRFQRRIGMLYAAKNAVTAMNATSTIGKTLEAYTAGINAYIRLLKPKDYPIEYKILDYTPEPWTPLKCALLLKYMAWMLTGRSSDLQMSNVRARFGEKAVENLFPNHPKNVDPVIPPGTAWNFTPVTITRPETYFRPATDSLSPWAEPDPANGSNNWAVSGAKTASGYPILANDPHLTLNLPSIWYEIQLVSPSVNVYGVSLPGSPNVIIGFNQDVAWGVTNAEADVLDWYQIRFKDASLKEYWYDGAWHPTRRVVEEIKVRGGTTVRDTVVYTHHGPVVWTSEQKPHDRQVPRYHAMRWVAHDPSNEALTFYQLNRAHNYDEYFEALSHYVCPAQNFAYADRHGNIAIWHNGKFPAKWEGQGKYIGDGSDPLYDWQGWIPHEQNPHVKNPKRGFVSSANQKPTDDSYPYYLGWYYAPPYRGHRINQRLAEMENIEPDDFRQLQLDTKNLHAEAVLPTLLSLVDQHRLKPEQRGVLERLAHWNYFSDADQVAPTVFDQWWRRLYQEIWYDEFDQGGTRLHYPSKGRTTQLILEEPQAKWFDNVRTSSRETLPILADRSFRAACDYLFGTLGPVGEKWRWGKYKSTDILHLARIPGLGRLDINVGGDLGVVNAIGRRHGPSWRMVVALGPEVQAWGIYPGGQSGNPGSPHYDDFIDDWVRGELAELLFLRSKEEQNDRIVSKLILEAK